VDTKKIHESLNANEDCLFWLRFDQLGEKNGCVPQKKKEFAQKKREEKRWKRKLTQRAQVEGCV
jgi:hypothetical protein